MAPDGPDSDLFVYYCKHCRSHVLITDPKSKIDLFWLISLALILESEYELYLEGIGGLFFVDPLEFKKQCHIQRFRIEVIQREPWEHIKDKDIKKIAASFCGEIWQVPPMFSAIKVGGEKMYEKAKRGESIELSLRRISIFQFDIEQSLDDRLSKAQLVASV